MKLLAFDTASTWCSAALLIDDAVIFRAVNAGQKHSELLTPMLSELLAEAGLSYRRLDGLAFGCGPGSFTGLRIACGVAQGLALGADLPVLGVSTLEALAEEAWTQMQATRANSVLACLDARMHEVYAALYQRQEQGWQVLAGPVVCAPEDAPRGPDAIGVGPGFAAYPEMARGLVGALPAAIPHARAIAHLAAPRFAAGQFGAPESAAPLYVRDKVALKVSER